MRRKQVLKLYYEFLLSRPATLQNVHTGAQARARGRALIVPGLEAASDRQLTDEVNEIVTYVIRCPRLSAVNLL